MYQPFVDWVRLCALLKGTENVCGEPLEEDHGLVGANECVGLDIDLRVQATTGMSAL